MENNCIIAVLTKVAASEPGSYYFKGAHNATVVALTDADTQGPIDAAPAYNSAFLPSGGALDAPSVTTQTDGALLFCAWSDQGYGSFVAPQGMVTPAPEVGAGSVQGCLLACDETVSAPGATGVRTATYQAGSYSGWTLAASFAIKPAGGAAPPQDYTGTGTTLTATASLATGQGVATQPEVHTGTGQALSALASVGVGVGAKASSGAGAGLTATVALGQGVGSKATTGTGAPDTGTAILPAGTGTKATGGDGASLLATALLGAGHGTATQIETHTGTGTPLAAIAVLGTGTGYTRALRDITLDASLSISWRISPLASGWGVAEPVGNPTSAATPSIDPWAAGPITGSPTTVGAAERGTWSTAPPERADWSAAEPYIQES